MELTKMKELRSIGVISPAELDDLLGEYEDHLGKIDQADIMAYMVNRAAIEALSKVFIRLSDDNLEDYVRNQLKSNMRVMGTLKKKIDSYLKKSNN